jgi:hypothetical protein
MDESIPVSWNRSSFYKIMQQVDEAKAKSLFDKVGCHFKHLKTPLRERGAGEIYTPG